jgi:hypothetical protein
MLTFDSSDNKALELIECMLVPSISQHHGCFHPLLVFGHLVILHPESHLQVLHRIQCLGVDFRSMAPLHLNSPCLRGSLHVCCVVRHLRCNFTMYSPSSPSPLLLLKALNIAMFFRVLKSYFCIYLVLTAIFCSVRGLLCDKVYAHKKTLPPSHVLSL